jgi:prepilin-type N-terminal cleavage/methylation domain-containing protein
MWDKKDLGFTLVEIIITVLIFSLLIGVLFTVLTTGKASFQIGDARIELQQDLRRGMDSITEELPQSGASYRPQYPMESISVPANGTKYSTITFRIPNDKEPFDDLNGNGVYDAGEPFDDLNGNGVYDDRDVVEAMIDADGNIEWGNQITYSLNGRQLLRNSDPKPLANNIISLQFSRQSSTPNIVEIALQSEKKTVKGNIINLDLNFQLKLRN